MGQACLACCTQFDCRITCIWTHMLTPLYLFSSLLSCLKRDKKHFPALNAQRNKHIPCIISLHSSFFLSLGLLLFPFPCITNHWLYHHKRGAIFIYLSIQVSGSQFSTLSDHLFCLRTFDFEIPKVPFLSSYPLLSFDKDDISLESSYL